MTDPKPQDLVNRLDDLLEEERDVLLQGELTAMARIAEEKEALIDALNRQDDQPRPDIVALQSKVMRNQILLDGALQGIRKVATRLAALRKIRRTLETYDETGQKQVIQGEVERRVEKRA